MVAHQAEIAKAKAAHARLVDVAAQSEVGSSKARAAFNGSKAHFGKVEKEAKLATANLDEAWKQSAGLDEATKGALCQLRENSSHAQTLVGEVSLIKLQRGTGAKARDDAIGLAPEQSRHEEPGILHRFVKRRVGLT